MLTGKWFEETKIGDAFGASLTVTETHLVLAAGLTGDFNPLHVDETYARGTRMGGRILHGTFTGAIVSAPAGMYFHGTAIAYLDQNCRSNAPVLARARPSPRRARRLRRRVREVPLAGAGPLQLGARLVRHLRARQREDRAPHRRRQGHRGEGELRRSFRAVEPRRELVPGEGCAPRRSHAPHALQRAPALGGDAGRDEARRGGRALLHAARAQRRRGARLARRGEARGRRRLRGGPLCGHRRGP